MKKKVFIFLLLLALSIFISPSVSAQTIFPPITTSPNCPKKTQGDANCDGIINNQDYLRWKCEFTGVGEECLVPGIQADFNQDKKVDLIDFEILRRGIYNEYKSDLTPTPTRTPTQILTRTPTPTPTRTLTPTITITPISTQTLTPCSACGLYDKKELACNLKELKKCNAIGKQCVAKSAICKNNPNCWTPSCVIFIRKEIDYLDKEKFLK